MADVAASAGVSLKTVSRVVNGDYVSADKIARVAEAIALLGFQRNEYARQLRQGTTSTIGLVLEDVANPFYSILTRAVEEVAVEHGYMLLTSSSAEDPERAQLLVAALGGRGVDGIILAPAEGMNPALLQNEIDAGGSLVLVDRPVDGLEADTVLADNLDGARVGAEQLLRHGHRRIAYFGDSQEIHTAAERHRGFVEAHRAAGVAVAEEFSVMAAPTDLHGPAAARLDHMLDASDPPTAIFSGNNRWSVALLRALRTRAESPAFVGFDDFELADVLQPGITVIAQDPARMGRLAAELLFRRITGDTAPTQRIELATTLIARGSGEQLGPF